MNSKTSRFWPYLTIVSIALLCVDVGAQEEDPIWFEKDGLVIIEPESTPSDLGLWLEGSVLDDYTGTGYLRFNGNSAISGDPTSPIIFNFKIETTGLYYFNLRCAKQVVDGRTDVANDAYIRVEGNYEPGPNPGDSNGLDAPLSLLKSNTKFFGGSVDRFAWSYGNRLDPGGTSNKRVAIYKFFAGEDYKLVISGRSKYFHIDRIVFRHESIPLATAHELSTPQTISIPQLANAGKDQIINISGGTIQLDGSRSMDAEIASYQWSQISGPSIAIISELTIVSPTVSNLEKGVYVFQLEAADGEGKTSNDRVSLQILPEGEDLAAIISFTLINGDTHEPIPEYDPIPDGAIINISRIDASLYSIRANSVPQVDFGSVTTTMSGTLSSTVSSNELPWTLLGYATGKYRARPFQVGEYTVSATPYGESGSGLEGTPLTIQFSFVEDVIPPTFHNISTRGIVGSGNNVMIAGFVIEGGSPKTILIQGVGKELANLDSSIEDELIQNPSITLIPIATINDESSYLRNEEWDDTDGGSITTAALEVGAVTLTPDSGSAAILATLQPGAYTIIVEDQNDENGGIALIEVYDVD